MTRTLRNRGRTTMRILLSCLVVCFALHLLCPALAQKTATLRHTTVDTSQERCYGDEAVAGDSHRSCSVQARGMTIRMEPI